MDSFREVDGLDRQGPRASAYRFVDKLGLWAIINRFYPIFSPSSDSTATGYCHYFASFLCGIVSNYNKSISGLKEKSSINIIIVVLLCFMLLNIIRKASKYSECR